jgi:hypothetical protein
MGCLRSIGGTIQSISAGMRGCGDSAEFLVRREIPQHRFKNLFCSKTLKRE